ncbi:MAG TPA: site-2 protease family protein [Candidatus Paceibacterota bacterium]
MSILIFLLVLAALIVAHEFGHFIVAKLSGIRVEEFAIGFPPRLFSVQYGETTYSLNLIFVGGFVRIAGENDGDDAADPRSFMHAPRLVQAAVVVGGIVGNIIAAWLLLSVAFMVGLPTAISPSMSHVNASNVELTVLDVLPSTPAARAGIAQGDVITSIQTGTTVLSAPLTATAAHDFIGAHGDESMVVTVQRDSAQKIFVLKPEAGVIPDEPQRKGLGVDFADVGMVRSTPLHAFIDAGNLVATETVLTAQGLSHFFAGLVTGHADLGQVSGPVGIAQAGASAAAKGWGMLLWFAAVISINLALINILPVPGLDGGRLAVIIIEAIRGRSLSARFHAHASMIGLSLLALLMVVVTWHDIAKLI